MSEIISAYPVPSELVVLRRIGADYILENWGAPRVVAVRAPLIWRSKPYATEQEAVDIGVMLAHTRKAAFMFNPERPK